MDVQLQPVFMQIWEWRAQMEKKDGMKYVLADIKAEDSSMSQDEYRYALACSALWL